MAAKSSTAQTAVSPPAGSGNVAGLGESFSLDLNSGQGTFGVPFEVPDGVAGLKPRVRLEYSHGQANGPFGLGWRLPLRQIDRRLDHGVPADDSGGAGGAGLVEAFLDAGVELRRGADGGFRALRETTFSRYDFAANAWTITERDGSRYVLGASPEARVCDPDRPDRVQSWLLERQEDVHGNAIAYVWERHEGFPYLSEVRWARFAVRLRYEPRPDVLLNGRAGFVRRVARRCASVSLHLATDGAEVRRLDLGYAQAAGSEASLLVSLRLSGFARGLPPVVKNPLTLAYAGFDAGALRIGWVEPGPCDAAPAPLSDPDTALLALDASALPGVLENRNGRLYYWPNDGRGGWAPPRRLAQSVAQATSFAADGVQFADLDGSGTADLLAGVGRAPLQGYYPNVGIGRPGEGGAGGAAPGRSASGFGDFVAYPRGAPARPPFETGRVRLADLDGDGLVDAGMSTARGLVTYRNRGRAGWSEPIATGRDLDVDLADPLTFFADMTGDGLPDLVQVRSGRVAYRQNLGHGRFAAPVEMSGAPRLSGLAAASGRSGQAGATAGVEQILLADVDGDGCADLLRLLPDRLELYLNRSGQAFAAPIVVDVLPTPLAGTARVVDFFAEAGAGLVYNSLRHGRVGYVHLGWTRTAPAYGLARVDNGNGLSTELGYRTAAWMERADQAAGRGWTTRLPFPLWVVERTVERDAVRGRATEVRYRYHDGHFDARARRFQGFREVDKTEVGDASRASVRLRHRFLVDQAAAPGRGPAHAHLDRLLERVETYSEDGSPRQALPLRIEETEYDALELARLPDGTPRVFPFARVTRKRHRERTDDERVEERRFEYGPEGDLVREVVRGFGTRAGVAVPEKLVDTRVEHATDPAGRIRKMARTVKRDAAGALLLETRCHYDGEDDAGLPLGRLTRGRLVREEHLVLDREAFDARYAGMDAAALGYVFQPDADGRAAVFAVDRRLTYTREGNVASESKGPGRRTEKTYDADALHVVEERSGGRASRRANDPVSGKPVEMVAPSGARVRMTYDAFGRLTRLMQADDTPETATRILVYDDAAVPNAVRTSYRVDAARRTETVAFYDGSAQQVQRRTRRDATEVLVTGWLEHNPWRQTSAEYEPTLSASMEFAVPDLSGPARRTRFDGEGRPVATSGFDGAPSLGRYTPFSIELHDAHDLDPDHPHAGTPRTEEVDCWNHRTAVVEATPAGPEVSRYEVGLFGELLAQRDGAGGLVARHGYDRRGRRLFVEHRDAGLREQWFDAAGDVVRMRDAAGHDVTLSRDAEGRITEVRVAGAVVESFVYDDDTPGVDGRLVEARYANGAQRFRYDARGMLVEHAIDVAGQAFTLRYEHDDIGRQTALTYPDGTRVTRAHDGDGLVTRIDGIVERIRYGARNRPTRIEYSNGVATDIEHEPGVGLVRRQRTTGPGGAVLEDAVHAYDALSQLVSLEDAVQGRRMGYEYDALRQLSRASGQDAQGPVDLEYAHLGRGRLASNGESGWRIAYDDPARPDLPTAVTVPGQPATALAHDADGNLERLPGAVCEYDFKSHLVRATLADGTVVAYDYDYRGNRVRRRVTRQGSTIETIYLGRMVEIQGGQHTNYVVLDRRRVALKRAGVTRWIHSDARGCANLFSDEAGTAIASTVYLPYGAQRASTGGPPPIRLFASHDVDEVTGLVYMGHRWYSPPLARFLTPDPLYLHEPERSDGDPAPLALYAYAGGDPVNRVDPDGLSVWSVIGAVVGVVVGIALAVAVVAAFACGIGFGVLAVLGVIGLVTVSYVVAHSAMGSATGEFFRGFMIGLNAGLNAGFLAMMGPVGVVVGAYVGLLIFLGSIDSVAGNEVYQGILGWSNWLMPMSWLVLALGAAMWILNGLGHLIFWSIPSLWGGGIQFFRIDGFKMDWSTGMLATRGGWLSNANTIDTAYNMGAFAFVDNNSTGWHLDHEAGHNLNLAAFGSIFHFVGFVHEMGTPAGAGALSEQIAESNDPGGTGPSLPMWA